MNLENFIPHEFFFLIFQGGDLVREFGKPFLLPGFIRIERVIRGKDEDLHPGQGDSLQARSSCRGP